MRDLLLSYLLQRADFSRTVRDQAGHCFLGYSGRATELSKVVFDELTVLIGVEPRIPPCLRSHYTFGSINSDGIGKRFPFVRTGRGNNRLRIVVLLLKGFDEGDAIRHAYRTENNDVCV